MQHRKRLSIPGVMGHSFQTVRFAFWNVLTFQLTYKLLAAIVFVVALCLICTEFAVLIIISYFAHKRQKVKLRPILYKTVTYLPTLFTYCLPGFVLYAVVLL